jgi:membrane protease YdiL (CAAX protease family)
VEEINVHTHHALCDECQSPVKPYHRFCYNCGAFLGKEAGRIDIFNNYHLRSAFFFYAFYLFICMLAKYTSWFTSYSQLFWIELVLAASTFSVALYNKTSIRPLLGVRTVRLSRLLLIVAIAVVSSCLVTLVVRALNVSLFHSSISYYKGYKAYVAPQLLMVYSIAFMPALFEELAFRGILYNYLAAVMDEKLVVIVTGFVFAAMHLNFISLLWLAPFGIFLGYLRRKYQTIWYGIVFHFVFNLVACIIDLYHEGVLF